MTHQAVETFELGKTYRGKHGDVAAVSELSLSIDEGIVFGLLGPNGAGKSTTVGMLTTTVLPTSGHAHIHGIDVGARPVDAKRLIGMVSQGNTLDRQLTVSENVEFRARYFGSGTAAAKRRAAELLELMDLSPRANALVTELSGGQAKRVMIARALAHRPRVLFLDEPTAALDPQTRVNLWEIIRSLRSDGQTVVLSTHYLDEAEELCDRVAIIDHGRLLACDTVRALTESTNAETVLTVSYDRPVAVPEGLAGVTSLKADSVRAMTKDPAILLNQLVAPGFTAGAEVVDVSIIRPSLESVFLTLTGSEYRE